MAVRYSLATVRKAGFVGQGGHIQFATTGDLDVALSAFAQASHAAEVNEADGRDLISTSTFTRVAGGPIANMHLCDSSELLETYLKQVAQALEEAGMSGRLSPVQDHEQPSLAVPVLTATMQLLLEFEAILAAPHDYDVPDLGWWVSPERTDRVVPRLIDWCIDTPGKVYFFCGFGAEVAPQDAKQLVLDNVRGAATLTLMRIDEDRPSFRRLVVHASGGVLLQIHDPHQTWEANRADLERPLTDVAQDVANAFIRPLPSWTTHKYEAWTAEPFPPLASVQWISPRLWFLAHLETEYLPDAYAQQIVTEKHLERLGDLPEQRWVVRKVGTDRYLVTAQDLKAWLDFDTGRLRPDDAGITHLPGVPDAQTLNQARQDFAAAILTPEALEAHPSPAFKLVGRFE